MKQLSTINQTHRTIKRRYTKSTTLRRQLINVEDTEKVFSSVSDANLKKHRMVLKLCAMATRYGGVDLAVWMMKIKLLSPLLYFVMKSTPLFSHFVAGESLGECVEVVGGRPFMGILSCVNEVSATEESMDALMGLLLQKIEAAHVNNIAFVSFKIGGLTYHDVFYETIKRLDKIDIDAVLELADGNIEDLVDVIDRVMPLSSDLKKNFLKFLDRCDIVLSKAVEKKVRVLIDAEQSYLQDAIHFFSLFFLRRHNKDFPWLYNTYQLYMKKSPTILNDHLRLAEKHDFHPGFKCVRGAYLEEENLRAQKQGYASPIFPTEQDTHNAYNSTVKKIMETITNDKKNLGLVIASHNKETVLMANKYLVDNKVPSETEIYFGQLMGMCDHLSYSLLDAEEKVLKLYPYGPIGESMPYLLRRMLENKGIILRTVEEQNLVLKELQRRKKD